MAIVRDATESDLDGLLSIDDAFARSGTPDWAIMTADTFLFKIHAGTMLVAFEEERIVGYIMWTLFWGFPFIEYARVLEADRGRGIGTKMLHALEERVLAGGRHRIGSSSQEPRARRWHERNGFTQVGEIKWIWGMAKESVLMKELGES